MLVVVGLQMVHVFFFVIVFVFQNFCVHTHLKPILASTVDHDLTLSRLLQPPHLGTLGVEFITLPGGHAALDVRRPIHLPLVGPGSLLTSSGYRLYGKRHS